eukprot:maker-scaffold_3-snap-gene-21.2-mRNA-1 protein AED:0.21 eAED:0.51 QI:0/0/0.5/1/1/1/2/95/163
MNTSSFINYLFCFKSEYQQRENLLKLCEETLDSDDKIKIIQVSKKKRNFYLILNQLSKDLVCNFQRSTITFIFFSIITRKGVLVVDLKNPRSLRFTTWDCIHFKSVHKPESGIIIFKKISIQSGFKRENIAFLFVEKESTQNMKKTFSKFIKKAKERKFNMKL